MEDFRVEIQLESERGTFKTIARCATVIDARKVVMGLIRYFDADGNTAVKKLDIVENGHVRETYTR